MKFPIFELERVQSIFENTVEFNLTESGFHPFTLKELLTPKQLEMIQSTVLGYGQTNGSPEVRERIAALYPNLGADNVLVTNGSSEANFIACHTLLEPGDEVVVMVPNYMSNATLLFKSTSLAAVIGLTELTGRSRQLANSTFKPIEFLTAAGVIYLAFTSVLIIGQGFLERRFALKR